MGKTTLLHMLSKGVDNSFYMCTQNGFLIDNTINQFLEKNSNTLFLFDDVDEEIDSFVEKSIISKILQNKNNHIVISTNIENIDKKKYNIVRLQPLDDEQVLSMLTDIDIPREEKEVIKSVTGGNVKLIEMFKYMRTKEAISPLEVLSILDDEKIQWNINEYSKSKKSKVKTAEKAKEILYQVKKFGPVSLEKLTKWNDDEDINQYVSDLKTNSYIFESGLGLYAGTKSIKFCASDEKKYVNHLVEIFSNDTGNIYRTNSDVEKLIAILKKLEISVLLVSTYYEEEYKKEEKKAAEERDLALAQIVSGLLGINQSVEDLNNQILDMSLDLINEINSLKGQISDCPEDIKKLDELLELVKNPEKSKNEIANTIVGTIGSLASVVSVCGVSDVPAIINHLINMISR